MTSIRNNPVWTPSLIEYDKALKEKYGFGAHIIPAREADYRRNGLPIPINCKESVTNVEKLVFAPSIRNNPVWTSSLIEQDKALKEKYGLGAHVIPATEADYRRNGLPVPISIKEV